MSSCDTIIMSNSPLFIDAVSHILKEKNINIVNDHLSTGESHPLPQTQTTTIIIDSDDPLLNEAEITTNLPDTPKKSLVISLSITKNQMIVLRRERVTDVTPAMLIDVIKNQR